LDAVGHGVALRLAESPFKVAAYNWGREDPTGFPTEVAGHPVRVIADGADLMASLASPKTVLVFSSEDTPMNSAVALLRPDLEPGDLLIDAGNSYFKDTARYQKQLARQGIQFMALGLAGGEAGVRHGAIVMSGGECEPRERVRPILEAMAATVEGKPCLSHFQSPAAAHFVRMVHAGIELALLQLLSETFDVLQAALAVTQEKWPDAPASSPGAVLHGYLAEIAGQISEPVGQEPPRNLLVKKMESAKNVSAAKWVVPSAWESDVPIPSLEASLGVERVGIAERWEGLLAAPSRHPVHRLNDDSESVLRELHGAFHAAMLITYAQGMGLLMAGSKLHDFDLSLHEIPRAWKGGGRRRASLLDDMAASLQARPDLPDLLADDDFSENVMANQESLRQAIWRAHDLGQPVPVLMASLDHLDANKAAWLPANLICIPHA